MPARSITDVHAKTLRRAVRSGDAGKSDSHWWQARVSSSVEVRGTTVWSGWFGGSHVCRRLDLDAAEAAGAISRAASVDK